MTASTSLLDPPVSTGIVAHAFNKDRSRVAVCPNTNQVLVYQRSGAGWALEATLAQHDELVTCVDWAPSTDRIVTCAQDRNAYVWTRDPADSSQWKPTLVLLRINRAATHVRWSPNEAKFAVASGASSVAVCYFEEDNDWWVSKHLKRPIRSTVLCLDWHKDSVLLAVGGTDMRAYVLSAFIKGVDKKPPVSPWGEKLPFGTVCGEYASTTGGWVRAVAFSPSGDALAFATHDSSVYIAYPAANRVSRVTLSSLPLLTLAWLDESRIVAAGFDCRPLVLEGSASKDWRVTQTLDEKKRGGESGNVRASIGPAALSVFKQMDSRAIGASGSASGRGSDGVALPTLHQNTITMLRSCATTYGGSTKEFTTSGLDGRLVQWSL